MGIWTEFLDEVCNSDITISEEFENNAVQIAIGKHINEDESEIIDIGFYGKDARGFANNIISFIANNHPLGINQEVTDFINTWGDIDPARNPRLGINISRSIGEQNHFHSANAVCFGGSMPYDCWWFFDDYDLPGQYANTSQAIEGIGGGLKFYYDLSEERFTTIKAYAREKNKPGDTLGNRTYSVDADNNLTLVGIQLCYEPDVPASVDDYSGRFEAEMPAVFDIKNRYHSSEYDENNIKSVVTMKLFEKTGNANTNPTNPNQGGLMFTYNEFVRSGAELPNATANTVINNRYRIRPYDSFIE